MDAKGIECGWASIGVYSRALADQPDGRGREAFASRWKRLGKEI